MYHAKIWHKKLFLFWWQPALAQTMPLSDLKLTLFWTVCRKNILKKGVICLSTCRLDRLWFQSWWSNFGLSKFITFKASYSSDQIWQRKMATASWSPEMSQAGVHWTSTVVWRQDVEAQRHQAHCFMPCHTCEQLITRKHIPRGQVLFYSFSGLHLPSLGTQ